MSPLAQRGAGGDVNTEEQFSRNLEHAFHLLRAVLRDPSELESIPSGTHVVPMPSDDLELCEANEAMVRRQRAARPSAHAGVADSTLLVNV